MACLHVYYSFRASFLESMEILVLDNIKVCVDFNNLYHKSIFHAPFPTDARSSRIKVEESTAQSIKC